MFLFDGATYKLHIPFLYGKTFYTQGENICNKLKLFLWGPWEGIFPAAPAQANNIIEYCI